MKNKTLVIILGGLILAGGLVFLLITERSVKTDSQADTVAGVTSTSGANLVFYYGAGCPHCQKVEDYIKMNKTDQKLPMEMKEVWSSESNANEMKAIAKTCGIADDKIGVPLLYDKSNQTCYLGDSQAIDYLTNNSK